jgi:hypothetical protein
MSTDDPWRHDHPTCINEIIQQNYELEQKSLRPCPVRKNHLVIGCPGSCSLQWILLKRGTPTAKIQGKSQVRKFGRAIIGLRRKGCQKWLFKSRRFLPPFQGHCIYIESFEREKDIVVTINRKLYPCVARTSLNYRVVQNPYLLNESPYIL